MARVAMTWPLYLLSMCRIDGTNTRLTGKEAEVLSTLLINHPDCLITKNQLIEAMWPDPDDEPETSGGSYIHVYMRRLRKRGILIENRYSNNGSVDYGGWRIPREGR